MRHLVAAPGVEAPRHRRVAVPARPPALDRRKGRGDAGQRRQRMRDLHAVQVAPAPRRRIGSGIGLRLPPPRRERAIDQRIARRHGISAHPRIGLGQDGEHFEQVDRRNEGPGGRGDDKVAEARQQFGHHHFIQQRRRAIRLDPAIPPAQQPGRLGGLGRQRVRNKRQQRAGGQRLDVVLERDTVRNAVPGLRVQHFGDAVVTERIAPAEADDLLVIGIVRGNVHLVGRREPAFLWIVDMGHVLDRQYARPVESAVARGREQAVMPRPDRRIADGLPAGIALDIGIMEIGGRRVDAEGLAQAGPVLRQVDGDDGKAHIAAGQHADGGEGAGALARGILRNDGPTLGITLRHALRRAVLDQYLVLIGLEPLPLPLVPVEVGVLLRGAQDEQVGLVDVEIGAAKGEAIRMPLHDAGQAGRAPTDDVQARRGQMHHVPWAEAANAQMRIIGQDRATSRAARRRDGPGVAALREAIGAPLRRIERGFLDRLERHRARRWQQHAQVGFADRRAIQAFGHAIGPGRAKRRHQLIDFQHALRLHLGAAHFVVGVPHADAARADEIAHVPAHRAQPQYAIFQRHLRRVRLQFRDTGVDAGDIALRAFQHAGRQGGEFGIDVAAIMEQARRLVRGDEGRAEGFGHAPHVTAMVDVDLEKPVAGDEIALTKIGVVQRARPHMRHAQLILHDVDRRAQAGQSDPAGPRLSRLLRPAEATRQGESGRGGHQECTTLDQHSLPLSVRLKCWSARGARPIAGWPCGAIARGALAITWGYP